MQPRQELEIVSRQLLRTDAQLVLQLAHCRCFGAGYAAICYYVILVKLVWLLAIQRMAAASVGPDTCK
jgi:hypothetical protein